MMSGMGSMLRVSLWLVSFVVTAEGVESYTLTHFGHTNIQHTN